MKKKCMNCNDKTEQAIDQTLKVNKNKISALNSATKLPVKIFIVLLLSYI